MISIHDVQITDILPPNLRDDAKVRSLSKAIRGLMNKWLDIADSTQMFATIDKEPAWLLDVMAAELNCPYYNSDLDSNAKRALIKRSFALREKAGTKAAVEELLKIVFGDGKVTEWFDYLDLPYTPGTFDINVFTTITGQDEAVFDSIISEVKNARSHIRRMSMFSAVTTEYAYVSYVSSVPYTVVPM